jgi:hypothetical protein
VPLHHVRRARRLATQGELYYIVKMI